MTKIVYNACYGGFGLSEEACNLYLAKKGLKAYPEKDGATTLIWTIPADHSERIKFNKLHDNWINLTGQQRIECNQISREYIFSDYRLDRADPILVEVVEELGSEKASGMCAQLKTEELPSGTLYRIKEYDGYESIETKHNINWKVA